MIAVDTNVLLRYLIEPVDSRNPGWQAEFARKLIDKNDSVYVSDIVVAELEWVLASVFEFTRGEIGEVVQALANNYRFVFDDWIALQNALIDYRDHTRVDLSDCLIARRAKRKGSETLYTFENNKGLGALPVATTIYPQY